MKFKGIKIKKIILIVVVLVILVGIGFWVKGILEKEEKPVKLTKEERVELADKYFREATMGISTETEKPLTPEQRKERYRKAKEEFEKLLKEEPANVKILSSLGITYYNLSEFEKAKEIFEKLIKLNPTNPSNYNILANILRDKSPPDLEKAETYYKKAIELSEGFIAAYTNLAFLYQSQNKLDQAIDILTKGLEKNPDDISLLLSLASSYEMKGEKEEAKKIYQKVLEIDPNNPVAKRATE